MTGERMKISITIPQDGSDAVAKIEYDYFARQNTKTNFTTAIALPVVNEINGLLTQLYINDSWASVGTTEKTGILRGVDIEITNGAYPEFNGNSLTFNKVGEGKIAILVTLTLVNGSEAIALHDAIGTMKVVNIHCSGPAIGSGENHALDIAFSGVVMEPLPGANKEKETSLTTVAFEGIYDPTGDKMLEVNVITNVASI